MYMMAFVTLVVALIGLYAQIYTKQAARMLSMQSGVADTMLGWHATAVSLATQLVSSSSITAAGCSMTAVAGGGAFLPCTYSAGAGNVNVWTRNYTAIPTCAGSQAAPCFTSLPTGYSFPSGIPTSLPSGPTYPPYTFYSVAFQNEITLKYYVLTYVPPPPVASDSYNLGLLCLPGVTAGTCPAGQQFTLTFADFYKQLRKNLNASNLSYGTVTSSGVLTTPSVSLGLGAGGTAASLTYTVPATIPVNSVAVIAEITPCATTVCP